MAEPMVQAPPVQKIAAQPARARKQGSMVWVLLSAIVGIIGLAVLGVFLFNRAAELKAQTREARTQCNAIRMATLLYKSAHPGGCPTVVQLEADGELDPSFSGTDPWGSSFKVQCTREDAACTSPGPDRTLGTPDDIREPPLAGK